MSEMDHEDRKMLDGLMAAVGNHLDRFERSKLPRPPDGEVFFFVLADEEVEALHTALADAVHPLAVAFREDAGALIGSNRLDRVHLVE